MRTESNIKRAEELYCMVHGKHQREQFEMLNPVEYEGWIKLGKFVRTLENKWTMAKCHLNTPDL